MRVKTAFLFLLGLAAPSFARDAGTPLQRVPAQPANIRNPFAGFPLAARAGAKLYARECAACHGTNREGIGKAPPLASREVREASPVALFWLLKNGSLKRGMPSFSHLPEPRRWQMITYLQTAEPQPNKD